MSEMEARYATTRFANTKLEYKGTDSDNFCVYQGTKSGFIILTKRWRTSDIKPKKHEFYRCADCWNIVLIMFDGNVMFKAYRPMDLMG